MTEYDGRNRRTGEVRRKNKDRRIDIRFEPGKKDRRTSRGRRTEDQDLWDKLMSENDMR